MTVALAFAVDAAYGPPVARPPTGIAGRNRLIDYRSPCWWRPLPTSGRWPAQQRALSRGETLEVVCDGQPPWWRDWQAFTDMDQIPVNPAETPEGESFAFHPRRRTS